MSICVTFFLLISKYNRNQCKQSINSVRVLRTRRRITWLLGMNILKRSNMSAQIQQFVMIIILIAHLLISLNHNWLIIINCKSDYRIWMQPSSISVLEFKADPPELYTIQCGLNVYCLIIWYKKKCQLYKKWRLILISHPIIHHIGLGGDVCILFLEFHWKLSILLIFL